MYCYHLGNLRFGGGSGDCRACALRAFCLQGCVVRPAGIKVEVVRVRVGGACDLVFASSKVESCWVLSSILCM